VEDLYEFSTLSRVLEFMTLSHEQAHPDFDWAWDDDSVERKSSVSALTETTRVYIAHLSLRTRALRRAAGPGIHRASSRVSLAESAHPDFDWEISHLVAGLAASLRSPLFVFVRL
jgi:hypothetical protein